jgi:tetrahydromethanopterin S-methyltransferase subunit F
MNDELSSSPHTNAVHYEKDGWGYRSQLIGERAQKLLGARCIRLDGISIGKCSQVTDLSYLLTNILQVQTTKFVFC